MDSSTEKTKKKSPRIQIKPKSGIRFDTKEKTKQKIQMKNGFNYPVDFKFRSTLPKYFRVDKVKGRIGENSTIAIIVKFLADLPPPQNIHKAKLQSIQISFVGPDGTPKIPSKVLKVIISFDGINPLSQTFSEFGNAGNMNSMMLQSMMIDSSIQNKKNGNGNNEKDRVLVSPLSSEDSDSLHKEDSIDTKEKEITSEEIDGEDQKKKETEEVPPKIGKQEGKGKGIQEKFEWERKKKKIMRQMFRFFPTFFGILVILLINNYLGFSFYLLKATLASFFVGVVISYVQIIILKEEKLVRK